MVENSLRPFSGKVYHLLGTHNHHWHPILQYLRMSLHHPIRRVSIYLRDLHCMLRQRHPACPDQPQLLSYLQHKSPHDRTHCLRGCSVRRGDLQRSSSDVLHRPTIREAERLCDSVDFHLNRQSNPHHGSDVQSCILRPGKIGGEGGEDAWSYFAHTCECFDPWAVETGRIYCYHSFHAGNKHYGKSCCSVEDKKVIDPSIYKYNNGINTFSTVHSFLSPFT